MEYNQNEIENFKLKLMQGQSLDDLTDLLNYVIDVQNQKKGTNYKKISAKRLKHYYANINKKYINFEIPKKTGGNRTITAPDKFLKAVQRSINLLLTLFFEPKPASHGFLQNRSIVTNAKNHVNKNYVLNIDLKDFFPSIHFGRIKAVLQLPIFKENDSKHYLFDYGEKFHINFEDIEKHEQYELIILKKLLGLDDDSTDIYLDEDITDIYLKFLNIDKSKFKIQNSFIEISYINGKAQLISKSSDFNDTTSKNILDFIEKKDVSFFTLLKSIKSWDNKKVTITDIDKPFSLQPEFAQIVANFCCFESKLPQGAPTSPIITNIVSQRLDYKLVKLAKEHDCFCTRYADDITFSSDKNLFDEDFMTKLNEIIKSEGFVINDKKTRTQNKAVRQKVTGITVNEKLNLQRTYIRKIRAALSNWEKHGYDKANAKFASYYPQEKGFLRNKTIPPMESVLDGKIMFLGMVRGQEDTLYLKYKNKLSELLKMK